MSKIIKTAIVGCGRVAFHHQDMLKEVETVKVVAVCDLIEEKASKLAGGFGCSSYTNYREMLAKEEIDLLRYPSLLSVSASHSPVSLLFVTERSTTSWRCVLCSLGSVGGS